MLGCSGSVFFIEVGSIRATLFLSLFSCQLLFDSADLYESMLVTKSIYIKSKSTGDYLLSLGGV